MNTQATVTYFDPTSVRVQGPTWEARLVVKSHARSGAQAMNARTRVYGAIETFSAAEDARYMDVVLAECRMIREDAEDTEAWIRCVKQAGTYLRAATLNAARPHINGVLADIAAALIEAGHTTFHPAAMVNPKFSSKAGCSCGCSPAFVAAARLTVDGSPYDVFLSLRKPE